MTRRRYSRLRVNVWKRGYGEIDNIGLVLLEFEQCHELPNGNTYCAGGGSDERRGRGLMGRFTTSSITSWHR